MRDYNHQARNRCRMFNFINLQDNEGGDETLISDQGILTANIDNNSSVTTYVLYYLNICDRILKKLRA